MKIIAGNCVLEDIDISKETAAFLYSMSKEYNFELIYKSSWNKDNRTSPLHFTGPPVEESIKIFKELKRNYKFKIITDFHYPDELTSSDNPANGILPYIDVVQIPAYLCTQSKLIQAVASTGKIINVKKGQFLYPEDIGCTLEKLYAYKTFKSEDIWITERGTSFGYRDLIVDPRSLDVLKRKFGHPVFVDITHSCRRYGIPSANIRDGASLEFAFPLAKMAVALNCDIFAEVHPTPPKAKCDASSQLDFAAFEFLMDEIIPIREGIRIATS